MCFMCFMCSSSGRLNHLLTAPFTVVSGGEVSAALALSGLWVAVVAVAVTVAGSALREAPETWQAVSTLAPRGPRHTLTLPGGLMAEGADCTARVTVTCCVWRRECRRKSDTSALHPFYCDKTPNHKTHVCTQRG